MIPFSAEVYFSLFEDANLAQWPAQLIAYGLAVCIITLARKPSRFGDRLIPVILAAGWCWIGISFFDRVLSPVLWAAWIFKVAFLFQAVLFLATAFLPKPIPFHMHADNIGWTAGSLLVVGLLIYPVLAAQLGHAWPLAQLLGVAPGPSVVFTIAVLSLAPGTMSRLLAVIPALSVLISAYVAWDLAIWEDLLLALAGGVGLVGLYWVKADKKT